MRAIVLFFLISGMLSACGGSDNVDKNANESKQKLQIVSSIKPIQAIVLAIAGEHAQSQQLIPDYASPHNYSFKPSDIRKVQSADVVFRIDEHMESQLNEVFDGLDTNTKLFSLAEVHGLKLLESNDLHQEHENETAAVDDNHEDHESTYSANTDFHIWTSAKNAAIIASAVTKTLSELDAKNAKHYQKNLEVFSDALQVESAKISELLEKYQNREYIVFHNSWQYFANEFGLHKPIVVDLQEGVSSGAKTISEIRSKIEKENIRCVFYDESVSEARLKLLTEKVKTIEIDVLAKGIEMDQSTYINWLRQLGKQVASCLSAN